MAIWECVCDCGNIENRVSVNLTNISCCKECNRKRISQRRIKNNDYDLFTCDYGIGYTSTGDKFLFDIEDYNIIKDYCWRLRKDGCLDAKIRDGSGKRILMHNLIMNHRYVDHIGGMLTRNDNRKTNLRINIYNDMSFETINNINKQIQTNNKSGVPGVCWHKRDSVWEVYISVNKKQIYLGRYNDFDEAVKIRKEAENKYFKEYSYENSQMINWENNLF